MRTPRPNDFHIGLREAIWLLATITASGTALLIGLALAIKTLPC